MCHTIILIDPPLSPKKRALSGHSLPRQGAGLRPSASAGLWVTNCFCLELKQEVLWPWSCANLPGYKAIRQSGNITDICVCLKWHLLGLWTKYGANRYPNTSSGQWKKCRNVGHHQYHNESITLSSSPPLADNSFFVDFKGTEGFAYSGSLPQLRHCLLEQGQGKARGKNPEQE